MFFYIFVLFYLSKLLTNVELVKQYMKFFRKEIVEDVEQINLVKDYEKSFAIGDVNESPIKELIEQGDYFVYSFFYNDETISLKDCFTIKINIKNACSVVVTYKLESFPKGEIISRIGELKKMDITDIESSKAKHQALFDLIKEYNPYFMVYQAKNGFPLTQEEMKELSFVDTIYLERVVEEAPVIEEKPQEAPQNNEKAIEENKSEKKSFKEQAKADLKSIAKNKYHFIFLTVSAFLFGFASSIGFCNAMLGKPISALFFVCAGVGMFLNTYVFIDYFKEFKIKERLFVYSMAFEVIGYALSLAATFIFYSLDKGEIKNAVSSTLLVGVSIGMFVGMVILSLCISYVIDMLQAKAKAKKASKVEEPHNND